MVKQIWLICCFFALLLYRVGALESDFILLEDQIGQGRVLRGVLPYQKGPARLSGELRDATKSLSRNRGFRLTLDNEQKALFLALGIPSTTPPGVYRLHLSGYLDDEEFEQQLKIEVVGVTFIKEEIALTETSSKTAQSRDPRKNIQRKRQNQILRHFDERALFSGCSFIVPVQALRRSAFYGDRRVYIFRPSGRRVAGSPHAGLDFSAVTGTPIVAPATGKVVFADFRITSGHTVILEHLPGIYTLYYHMNAINVAPGELVNPGKRLGEVGATGIVTGAHLHWELRVGAVAVDPALYLGAPLLDKQQLNAILQARQIRAESEES